MKKTIIHIRSGHLHLRVLAAASAAILALAPILNLLFIANPAGATQTTQAYCAQYTSNSKLNACKSGVRGDDCSDYAVTFDQATADVCTKAHQDKVNGLISDNPVVTTTPSTSPSPSTTPPSTDAQAYKNAILNACAPYSNDTAAALWCLYGGLGQNGTESKPKTPQDCLSKPELQGSSINQGACITGATAGQSYLSAKNGSSNQSSNPIGNSSGGLQDILDQSQNLSSYLDVLHALGPNANVNLGNAADNNFDSYVNGAGKQQPIRVFPGAGCTVNPAGGAGLPTAANTGCPVIVEFNGGGWHSDDGTSYCFATGSPKKNCQPGGSDGGGDTGAGDVNVSPPGGGANARGYTVIEVTYRLGSSGVYYMFEDVMRGIQHVRNNAAMYGIDPNKMALMGDSAGGSLSIRAGASGKSGAKVMVGWSAPTNAYTALFKSYKSFLIGMDHSTCVPTDLAGLTNFTDLLNGGSGNVAQYGQGLSSNDFSGLGITGGTAGGAASGGTDAISTITQVLTAGQYATQTSQNVESISQQLQNGGIQGMSGSLINLSANKLSECLDNFNALSPALFASPDSPAGFLAGFDDDDLIDPQQAYDMRDKLLGLGVEADVMILQGDAEAGNQAFGASDNHLGYDPRFVCKTLNFIDHIIDPGKQPVECDKPAAPPTASDNSSGGGGDSSGGGGGSSATSGSTGGGGTSTSSPSGCGALGSSATCNGSSNGGTPTSCPAGLVPGSHSCVQPIGGGSNGGTPNSCPYGQVPGSHSCVAAKCPEGGTPQYDQWGTSYWCK